MLTAYLQHYIMLAAYLQHYIMLAAYLQHYIMYYNTTLCITAFLHYSMFIACLTTFTALCLQRAITALRLQHAITPLSQVKCLECLLKMVKHTDEKPKGLYFLFPCYWNQLIDYRSIFILSHGYRSKNP